MSSIEKKVFNLLSTHKDSYSSIFKVSSKYLPLKSSRLLTGAFRLGKKDFNKKDFSKGHSVLQKIPHMIHCGKSPRHTYEDFFISSTVIPQSTYNEVMRNVIGKKDKFLRNVYNGTRFNGISNLTFVGDTLPAHNMNEIYAKLFCNELSIMCGLQPYYSFDSYFPRKAPSDYARMQINEYPSSSGFRLPFHEEYISLYMKGIPNALENKAFIPIEDDFGYSIAKRFGNIPERSYMYDGKPYTFPGFLKEEDLNRFGWNFFNSDVKMHPICELEPSPLGFYDLAGNVFEWCDSPIYQAFDEIPVKGEIRQNSFFHFYTHLMKDPRDQKYRYRSKPGSMSNFKYPLGGDFLSFDNQIRVLLQPDGYYLFRSFPQISIKFDPIDLWDYFSVDESIETRLSFESVPVPKEWNYKANLHLWNFYTSLLNRPMATRASAYEAGRDPYFVGFRVARGVKNPK